MMQRALAAIICITALFYISNTFAINDSIPLHRQLDEVDITTIYPHKIGRGTLATTFPREVIHPNSASLNALLSRIPSIDCEIDGIIRLRGSDKISILIDGRPTALMGEKRDEVVIQLPVAAIDRIVTENIPRTGAKNIPDGDGGIIDIILKRNYTQNFTTSVHAATANNDRYQAGVKIGMPYGNHWSFDAGAEYKKEYRTRSFDNTIVKNRNSDKETTQLQDNTAKARPETVFADLGFKYENAEKNYRKAGTTIFFYQTRYDRIGNIHNTEPPKELRIVRNNNLKNNNLSANIFYIQSIGKSGKNRINTDFSYRYTLYDENNAYDRTIIVPKPNLIRDNLFIDQNSNEYDARIDFSSEVNDIFKLHTGYMSRILQNNSRNLKEMFSNDIFSEVPSASWKTKLTRNIQALYLQGEMNFDEILKLEIGLRGEYVHRVVSRIDTDAKTAYDYWHLYPNILAEFCFDKHTFSAQYAQRTNRPTIAELNPFIDESDPADKIQGNPLLKPEITNSLNIGYYYRISRFSEMKFSVFYRNRKNSIVSLLTGPDMTTISNLYNSRTTGLETEMAFEPLKWIRIDINGCVFHDEIQADKKGKKRNGWTGQVKGGLAFRMTPSTTLQCNGTYITDVTTAQGTIRSRYRIDTGINQIICKGKGYVNLSIDDWLGSSREITVVDTASLYKRTVKSRDNRIVWLDIGWNLFMKN